MPYKFLTYDLHEHPIEDYLNQAEKEGWSVLSASESPHGFLHVIFHKPLRGEAPLMKTWQDADDRPVDWRLKGGST